ncbi:MAG: hypothetical protein HQL49_07900 [Gammaproteobacteria bacterium]|nr:hypothetical protein [Gammaproteobacteria bacterium]
MIKAFFKFLLFLLIWALIAGIVIGPSFLLESYSTELGIKIFAGIFFTWLTFAIVRKIYRRYQAKKRVEKLISVEDGVKEPSAFALRFGFGATTSLEDRFKKIQDFISKSHLKDQGDANYLLPWYLIVGANDSDRPRIYRQADLTETVVDIKNISSHGNSFDWYLTNQMVLVDGPEKVFNQESKQSTPEWLNFARILRKRRSKECLNGIVVVLDIDLLQSEDRNALRDLGRRWRRQIDDLMRITTMRLPIYLVVNGVDKLQGAESWWSCMTETQRRQAFGTLIDDERSDGRALTAALDSILLQLKRHQLDLLYGNQGDSDLLLFPGQIAAIADSLNAFGETLFEYSTYHGSLAPSGLFMVGESHKAEPGLTAHAADLFEQVLPSQRGHIELLESALKKERNLRLLWRGAWATLLLLFALGFYYNYSENIGYLRDITDTNSGSFMKVNDYGGRVETLERIRILIINIDETINGWYLPWLYHYEKADLVKSLREIYVKRFYEEIGKDEDSMLFAAIDSRKGTKNIRHRELGELVTILSGRIAQLEAYTEGAGADDLEILFNAPYNSARWLLDGSLNDVQVTNYNLLYIYYLVWRNDLAQSKAELVRLKESVDALMLASGEHLDWLIEWANLELRGGEVLLKDFWPGSGRFPEEVVVKPAYTIVGKTLIDDLLEQVQHREPIAEGVVEQIARFRKRYEQQYIDAWGNFLARFDEGIGGLRGRREWLESVETLARGGNPFFSVLEESYEQLLPWIDAGNPNEWLAMLSYYQNMKIYSPHQSLLPPL